MGRATIFKSLWRLTMAVSVLVKANGSTVMSSQVSISDAMVAQFSAPASWPAKSAF